MNSTAQPPERPPVRAISTRDALRSGATPQELSGGAYAQPHRGVQVAGSVTRPIDIAKAFLPRMRAWHAFGDVTAALFCPPTEAVRSGCDRPRRCPREEHPPRHLADDRPLRGAAHASRAHLGALGPDTLRPRARRRRGRARDDLRHLSRGSTTGQRCAAPRCPHRGFCARNHPRARHAPVDLGRNVGARGRPLAPDSSTRDEDPIRRVGTCRRYSAGAVSSGAGVASGGSEEIASWTAAWMAGISGLPWSKFGGTTSNRTLLPLRDFRSRSPT